MIFLSLIIIFIIAFFIFRKTKIKTVANVAKIVWESVTITISAVNKGVNCQNLRRKNKSRALRYILEYLINLILLTETFYPITYIF